MPARPEPALDVPDVDPVVVALVDAAPPLTDAQVVVLRRALAAQVAEDGAAAA